jgi:hypothetical protein
MMSGTYTNAPCTSEFCFGDKVREGLAVVGAFLKGTTVTR